MGKNRHCYAIQESAESVLVYRFIGTTNRDWLCAKHYPLARHVGSTNRFVVAAIKMFKKGQEWPIHVNKN